MASRMPTFLAVAGLSAVLGGSVTQAAAASLGPARVEQKVESFRAAGDLQVVDVEVASKGVPFNLTRYYHWDPAASSGMLGKGWRLSLEARLEVSADTIILDDADGTKVPFIKQSDGTYTSPEGAPYKLTAAGESYSLKANDGSLVRNFDKSGRLTSVVNGAGAGLKLAYTSTGRIASVADAEGRVAYFSTDSSGQLVGVTLAAGGHIAYSYTSQGYLSKVAGVDGTVRTYVYDSEGRLIQ
ncbi:DUF6531 domain-containing protein [Streptomyces sp. TP-A0356]|uniref:DUF6531 domain-containing protein n=1 Tax=Streptomyces sp. TP-A0356 TaxID=1359208 RepID=UPI000AE852EC|nr:DUF6531 domain-containing protein [Streptomyces sp. TP-A0356]